MRLMDHRLTSATSGWKLVPVLSLCDVGGLVTDNFRMDTRDTSKKRWRFVDFFNMYVTRYMCHLLVDFDDSFAV